MRRLYLNKYVETLLLFSFASTTSTHRSESPMTSGNETETEEDKDPWMPMVEEAMQNHRTTFEEIKMNLIHIGLDEQSAIEKAYANILP